jgi:hypothetical protein
MRGAWLVMVSYGKGLGSRLRVGVRVRIRIRVRVRVGVRVSVRVRAEPKALSGQSLANKIGKIKVILWEKQNGDSGVTFSQVFFLLMRIT